MNQRSRRLRLTEWAALVDAEVPERALENPTLSTASDQQLSSEQDEDGSEPPNSWNGRNDGSDLRRGPN